MAEYLPPYMWQATQQVIQRQPQQQQAIPTDLVPAEQALQQVMQQPIAEPKPVMLAENNLSNYDYNIPLKNKPNFEQGVDTITNMPKRKSNVPFKGLVFHIPAKENIQKQLKISKKDKSGYNIIVDEKGDVNFYANPQISAQQISPPQNPQRTSKTISENMRNTYGNWSNTNTLSMGIMGGLTEKNKPTIFDVTARLFATYDLPLTKKSVIGHGEIQHTPKGDKWPRQTLGKNKTPEGQEFKNFILDNWDSFVERVNLYKKSKLSQKDIL